MFLYRYYVGVQDEKTGKMQICDAELFQMKPHIQGKVFYRFDHVNLTIDGN